MHFSSLAVFQLQPQYKLDFTEKLYGGYPKGFRHRWRVTAFGGTASDPPYGPTALCLFAPVNLPISINEKIL